jgi:OH-DDVA meta-cleavage compound hydrolase
MIIDAHSHVCAAPELYVWKSQLLASRGAHGLKPPKFTPEFVREHAETKKNLAAMDKVGTDVQFLSPRPFQLMHGEKPAAMVEAYAAAMHDYIAQQVTLYTNRFQGVCGMPQVGGEPVTIALPELERCVKKLGFIGTLIDTDPGEGDNSTPILSDRYWYPRPDSFNRMPGA